MLTDFEKKEIIRMFAEGASALQVSYRFGISMEEAAKVRHEFKSKFLPNVNIKYGDNDAAGQD